MIYVKQTLRKFRGVFGLTDAMAKDHEIQSAIMYAALLNLVLQFLTLLVHQEVLDDLTLRVYFEKGDSKRRGLIATILWAGLSVYMVSLQRSHTHVLPTMAALTFCFYCFCSVLIFGAFTATGVH